MARNKQATPKVDKEALYIKGVAKNLVDRLYGPQGPPWGTKFREIEATVAAIREILTEAMFQQALSRQAAVTHRPPEYTLCPDCGRSTRAGDPPEARRIETGQGDAIWDEPKTRCEQCRRDFFPSEQEFGH
jgi:hypothetical protein